MKLKNFFLLFGVTILVTACNRFGTDNTPAPTALEPFTPTITLSKLWNKGVGDGDAGQALRFTMILDQGTLFTTDAQGYVSAVDANTGRRVWSKKLKNSISGGIGAGQGVVAVAGANAELYALDQQTGNVLWQTTLENQALAAPSVAKNSILVKTIDDQVIALDIRTGKVRWSFASGAPQLMLRFGSSPVAVGDKVVIGSASGKVFVVSLSDGTILWEQLIATPMGATDVQQMVDIDITPVVEKGIVYVATYQGNIAVLQLNTGVALWHHTLSSYTGIAVNNENLYITDADSHLWLFHKSDGLVQWQQDKLAYRKITAPALVQNYVVVGDQEGYLHVLGRDSGQFAARVKVSSDAILSAPVVQGNNIYVLTQGGTLAAYKLG